MAKSVDQLFDATIDSVDESILRSTLRTLCSTVPNARMHAEELLLAKFDPGDPKYNFLSGLIPKKARSTGPKLISRWQKCANCSDIFDVDENSKNSCVYHDGERKVNHQSHVFDELYEESNGEISSHEIEALIDDPEYAEGVFWTCCKKESLDEGCNLANHVPFSPTLVADAINLDRGKRDSTLRANAVGDKDGNAEDGSQKQPNKRRKRS